MPIQIIWGNDIKACENEIEKIINTKISKEWQTFNLSKLNGDDEDQVYRAFEEMQIPPFGDGSRVIVLKNNPIFNLKNDKFTTKFESASKNVPNSTLLILNNTNKPDSRIKSTRYLKSLIREQKASELFFNLPDIWNNENQIKFVKNIAKTHNIHLEENAASLIIESIGTESTRLDNELQKALLYVSAKNNNETNLLTVNDIKNVLNENQSNIFKVIDSLIEKNISQGLHHINILINHGEPPLRLIAGLISQVRIHTIVLLLLEEKDLSKISKIAGISNPKRIFFIRQKVKNCNPQFLINLMIKLLDIESFLKRGSNPIDIFTENLASLT
tara:strand:+ start:225 stop:1214 length:990 start_codon:yes stop_codon:yes gene_type:complete